MAGEAWKDEDRRETAFVHSFLVDDCTQGSLTSHYQVGAHGGQWTLTRSIEEAIYELPT